MSEMLYENHVDMHGNNVLAIVDNDKVDKTTGLTLFESKIIGFNMNLANSASGYGQSLNLNVSIEKERRLLETGVIMQQKSARIYGGEILYRHYSQLYLPLQRYSQK